MNGQTSRRVIIGAILAAPLGAVPVLSGEILGEPLHRGTGPDLGFVAEEWLRDARALGMLIILGPDRRPWRVLPFDGDEALIAARTKHWVGLNDRPRLQRAVYAAVLRGFVPEASV